MKPNEHQQELIIEALYNTLVKCGVIQNGVSVSGPELLLAAETFLEQK